MAKLSFYGAVDGVTGSAYILETSSATILLECGLIQGSRKAEEVNRAAFPFEIDKLDAVVLSHAHLDHSGRIPKLVAEGYRGPVYMTNPTRELLDIMLKDSAFLSMRDAEWENRRRQRSGRKKIEPLYTLEDVEAALPLCNGVAYDQHREIAEGVVIRYRDAGHILGSAIVEVFISEQGVERKLVFSGDLGNSSAALLRDPQLVASADVLLLESTYGDRDHRPMEDTLTEFEGIIEQASENGGNILIPSFAIGRTQEIIFRLGEMYQQGRLRQQAIFLDSPMAISATEVYQRYQKLFNHEDKSTIGHAHKGTLETFLPVLRFSRSTEESMAINRIEAGAIIIAGSGMCTGGRIRHHLKHNLWRRNAHVLIVGYQAFGTTGRKLVDGAKSLKLAGEDIVVKAQIHTLGGFSAHAGQSQLLNWVDGFKTQRPEIFLVHGEDDAKQTLQRKLQDQGWRVKIPKYADSISI